MFCLCISVHDSILNKYVATRFQLFLLSLCVYVIFLCWKQINETKVIQSVDNIVGLAFPYGVRLVVDELIILISHK